MRKIIIGERYAPILSGALAEHGFTPIWMPDNPCVDPRLAGHTDLSVYQMEDGRLILAHGIAEGRDFVNFLTIERSKFTVSAQKQGRLYPEDVGLCACRVGDKLIHRSHYTAPEIRENFHGSFINVRQGYARCTICPVGNDAIITADCGIAAAAEKAGIAVLGISEGFIELAGFSSGFIGGASFSDGCTVYFTGTLDSHPDRERILRFISSRGLQVRFLTRHPAFDIGGAVLL